MNTTNIIILLISNLKYNYRIQTNTKSVTIHIKWILSTSCNFDSIPELFALLIQVNQHDRLLDPRTIDPLCQTRAQFHTDTLLLVLFVGVFVAVKLNLSLIPSTPAPNRIWSRVCNGRPPPPHRAHIIRVLFSLFVNTFFAHHSLSVFVYSKLVDIQTWHTRGDTPSTLDSHAPFFPACVCLTSGSPPALRHLTRFVM